MVNNEICIACKKPMGNSMQTISDGIKEYPMHRKCRLKEGSTTTTKIIEKYNSSKEETMNDVEEIMRKEDDGTLDFCPHESLPSGQCLIEDCMMCSLEDDEHFSVCPIYLVYNKKKSVRDGKPKLKQLIENMTSLSEKELKHLNNIKIGECYCPVCEKAKKKFGTVMNRLIELKKEK